MPKKKFAGQTRRQEKAGNLFAETLSSEYALFVRKYEDKIITLIKEAIHLTRHPPLQISSKGESNDYLSSTTSTTNQFFSSTLEEIFVQKKKDKSTISQVLALFLNFRIQNVLNYFGRKLLFLFIEEGSIHLWTKGWLSLYEETGFRKASWRVLWEQVQPLETLGLVYHVDLLSPEGKHYRGNPNLYCLFDATDTEKRVAILDYYNHQKQEEYYEAPIPRRKLTMPEIIEASLPKQEPIYRIAKMRKEAEPLYRERFKAMGYSGDDLEKFVQASLDQHYSKNGQVKVHKKEES